MTPNTSSRRSRFTGHADILILLGASLWVIAQFLPATVRPDLLDDGVYSTAGLDYTLFAWSLALSASSAALSIAILLAESANVWFLIAIIGLGFGRRTLASASASLATVGCLVGIVTLVVQTHATNSVERIVSVEPGTWVWLAGTVVVTVAVHGWAHEPGHVGSEEATVAPPSPPVSPERFWDGTRWVEDRA